MSYLLPIMLLVAVDGPTVDVADLTGDTVSGQLSGLSATAVTLQLADGNEQTVPLDTVRDVAFKKSAAASTPTGAQKMVVTLADDSVLTCTQLEVTGRAAQVELAHVGETELRLTSIASILLKKTTNKNQEKWKELLARETKRDMLVIEKGEVLDHVDGYIGDITETKITFLLDGDEIPVNRDKVFGIIFAPRRGVTAKPVCRAQLEGGSSLHVREISWAGSAMEARLLDGSRLTLPAESLRLLDFSLGKIQFLSAMETRGDPEYSTFFEGDPACLELIRMRSVNGDEGHELKVGNKYFVRGLVLGAKTTVRYRIGGDYRRFRAVAGFDFRVSTEVRHGDVNRNGTVDLIISGDGRELYKKFVTAKDDQPTVLDIDVSGVRDLEIVVDFGDSNFEGDWLVLANAHVTK